MKFHDEAGMQSAFTRWARSPVAATWIGERNGGIVAAAFELKHVACKGMRACTPARCASRLRIGEHEEGQLEALRRAQGADAARGRPTLAYKISDMSAGYKPFDCFVLGGGVGAWFVVGWSCPRACRTRVRAVAAFEWGNGIKGRPSVRESDIEACGELVEIEL